MLKVYDPLDDVTLQNDVGSEPVASDYYFASELADELGIVKTSVVLQDALLRAMQAGTALGLPLRQHFRRIHYCSASGLQTDWQLSALACYLMLMNGFPGNPQVVKAQLFLLKKR